MTITARRLDAPALRELMESDDAPRILDVRTLSKQSGVSVDDVAKRREWTRRRTSPPS